MMCGAVPASCGTWAADRKARARSGQTGKARGTDVHVGQAHGRARRVSTGKFQQKQRDTGTWSFMVKCVAWLYRVLSCFSAGWDGLSSGSASPVLIPPPRGLFRVLARCRAAVPPHPIHPSQLHNHPWPGWVGGCPERSPAYCPLPIAHALPAPTATVHPFASSDWQRENREKMQKLSSPKKKIPRRRPVAPVRPSLAAPRPRPRPVPVPTVAPGPLPRHRHPSPPGRRLASLPSSLLPPSQDSSQFPPSHLPPTHFICPSFSTLASVLHLPYLSRHFPSRIILFRASTPLTSPSPSPLFRTVLFDSVTLPSWTPPMNAC